MESPLSPRDPGFATTLAAWRAGDPAAIAEVYQRFFSLVREVVRMRLGARLRVHVDSGDVIQDVFARLLRTPPPDGVRTEAQLADYLARSVLNQVTDAGRRAGRAKRDASLAVGGSAGELALAAVPSPEPTPSQIQMGKETYARYLEAVDALPETQREAIVLARHVGLPADDAAERLGLKSAGAFRALLSRALAKVSLALE